MTSLVETPSLAEAQTRAARLAAEKAQKELAEAEKDTLTAEELSAASAELMRLLTASLRDLPESLFSAIGDETENARVHYLLTDAVHHALQQISRRVQDSRQLPADFSARWCRGAKPRDLLTVSQWADRYRVIISGTNAPGEWRTARTPYLREIMDDLSEHSPVEMVVIKKSSGLGGTEAMYNWIGYSMHHLGNRDMLIVVSTLELRDRSLNPRLSKMFRETPALVELIERSPTRNASNRVDLLEYSPTARLIKAGANSPDSLRSDHLPYVIVDEVDSFPWDVGGEGDPLTLIQNRQRTFRGRSKLLAISTPTNETESRIDQLYRSGDRRQYHVPCPHCQAEQVLDIEHLHYRLDPATAHLKSDKEQKIVLDAWYVCPSCGAEIREGEKTAMLSKGRWVPRRMHVKKVHSYHINALYSPIGLGLSWVEIAQRKVDSENDTSKRKAFVNTDLGEVYKEQGDGADPNSLLARVENYSVEDIRIRIRPLRIVAGVDVQKDRLEASIAAFSRGEECWLLSHVIIPGDTTDPETWEELDLALRDAGVRHAAIDAGYNTTTVVDYCSTRAWTTPTKGISGAYRPIIEDERKRRQRLRQKRRKGRPVEPIGVDAAKSLLYARLRNYKKGPGAIHFPADPDFDDEYFLQLTAEELRLKIRNGRESSEWVAIRPRNEALDCLILCYVAHRLSGPIDMHGPEPVSSQETGESETAVIDDPQEETSTHSVAPSSETPFDIFKALAQARKSRNGRV